MKKSITDIVISIAEKTDLCGPFIEGSREVKCFERIFKAGMRHERKLDNKKSITALRKRLVEVIS